MSIPILLQNLVLDLNTASVPSERIAKYNQCILNLTENRLETYKEIIQHLLKTEEVVVVKAVLKFLFRDSVLCTLDDDDEKIQLLQFSLFKLQQKPTLVSYEEELTLVRQLIASIYEDEGEFAQAANALKQINFNTLPLEGRVEYEASTYLKIAELKVLNNEAEQSRIYLDKAKLLIDSLPNTNTSPLHFKYEECSAHLLDLNGRFREATRKYYVLAQTNVKGAEQQLLHFKQAIVSSFFLPLENPVSLTTSSQSSSSSSSPSLSTSSQSMSDKEIYDQFLADARIANLGIYKILLEKLSSGSIVSREEVNSVIALATEDVIHDHIDKDTLRTPFFIHNIRSAATTLSSKTLSFSHLSSVLALPEDEVELLTAQLMSDGQLRVTIDPGKALTLT